MNPPSTSAGPATVCMQNPTATTAVAASGARRLQATGTVIARNETTWSQNGSATCSAVHSSAWVATVSSRPIKRSIRGGIGTKPSAAARCGRPT